MSTVLRIGTRESELALRRARAVQAMLGAAGIECQLVTFKTAGDKHFEEPISPASTKTVFTKELDAALGKKKVDLAVHALSDVSTDVSPGLVTAAVLPRDDPRDALVLNRLLEAESIPDLPRGSRIGTSSMRCRSLLRALYPLLEVVHLRGDLRTRLHKLDDGQVHGTIVSIAALRRLEITQHIALTLEPPAWLPAPGQGAIAIQTREDDVATRAIVELLDHARTRTDTSAERALLGSLEGGLQSPVGALVVADGGSRVLSGVIVDPKGGPPLRAERPVDDAQPELAGVRLANDLRAMGANRILDAIRGGDRTDAPQPDG